MMFRTLCVSLALGTAFAAVQLSPAYGQTTQTDQSEEDWRKSRKKRSTTPDIFDPNTTTIGRGINDIKPLTPMERLPRDSQRHLKKMRAEIIAESDPGEDPNGAYTPSEAAKTDPDLAAQEEEAWKIIMTDLELGGGQGGASQDQTQGGEKIAVVGRNTTPPSGQNSGGGGFGGGQGVGQGSGTRQGSGAIRGGSSSSVADILAQIKGIKAGRNLGGSGQGGSSQGGSSQGGGSDSGQIPSGGIQGRPQTGGAGGSQGQNGQNSDGGQSGGQAQQGQSQQGEGQSAQGQNQSQSGQAQNQGNQNQGSQNQGSQDQDGQGQSQGQQSSQGQSQSQGQSDQDSQSSQGQQSSQSQDAAQSQASSANRRERERISPLETLKRERRERTTGDTTSASDFLKKPPVTSDK